MTEKIVVSRKWKAPEIKVYITVEDVGASMDVDVFLSTLVEAMKNPAMVMTKQQLLTRMMVAKEEVVREMKRTTVYV